MSMPAIAGLPGAFADVGPPADHAGPAPGVEPARAAGLDGRAATAVHGSVVP